MALPRRLFVAFVVAGAVIGCGEPVPKTGTVSGTVLVAGKPLRSGLIGFIPADGRVVQADIQVDGTYKAENVPVGEAIVVLNPAPGDGAAVQKRIKETNEMPPPVQSPIPKKYNDPATSDLRFNVQVGSNQFSPDVR